MTRFETKVCSRCGGSGKFPFNLMHGTMCYGCFGSGVQLTKRGEAAKEFLERSLEVPVETLKVGDGIKMSIADRKFGQIMLIDFGPQKEIALKHCTAYEMNHEHEPVYYFKTATGCTTIEPGAMVRRFFSNEEKEPFIQAALAYQDTLTASGNPKKRGKKSV